MSRERRDEGKEEAPQAVSAGTRPTGRADAPIVDAGYQARCDARVLQFLSAPLPLTPSEREAREAGGEASGVHAAAERGVSGAATVLPHGDTIQAAFGPHDISGVKAHVGGPAADACGSMGASAYATGNQVAFAGQPDLHTAAHEAAHVVQQRQGVQLYGGVGAAGDVYERQADAVADAVVAGKSAAGLLGAPAAEAAATKSVQAFGGLYIAGGSPAAEPAANGGAAPASTAALTGPNVNRLVATDPSVEFGPTPVGATTYKPLTFVNRGAAPVEPGDFVVRPGVNAQADDFSVAGGDATSGAALTPGEAISLQVAFHPHPRPDQDPKRWPGRVAHIDVLDLAGARAGSVKVRGQPRPTDEATQGAHEAAELVGASRNHADVPAPVSYADMLAHLRAARELLSTGDREHAQALIHAVRERMAAALREDKSWPRLRGFGLGAQAGIHLINQAYDEVVAADRGLGADWRVDADKLVTLLEVAREPIQYVLRETKDAPTLRAFHDASPAVMVGHAIEGMAEHTIEMVTDGAYTVGYLSGLVEGAYGAVRDLVMGFADLVGMTADIVKAMWSRGFVGAVQHFGRQVADIFDKAPELLEALGADFARKWNQHGSFDRGNFRGEVMGYIAMQILLIIATAGEGAAAAAGRWPKVLAVIRTLDAAGDIFSWAETAADGVRALRKTAKAVGKAEDAADAAGKGAGKVLKMGGDDAPDAPSASKVPGGPEVDAPKAGAQDVETAEPATNAATAEASQPGASSDSQAPKGDTGEHGGNASEVAVARRAELEDAIPEELRGRVSLVLDSNLPGTTVQVRYGDRLEIRVGPDGTPRHVQYHVDTVRALLRFEGVTGQLRKLLDQVLSLLKIRPGYGTRGFEASLEVKKLVAIKDDLEALIRRADGGLHNVDLDADHLRAEMATVEAQLAKHRWEVDSYIEGTGLVEARGLPSMRVSAAEIAMEEVEHADMIELHFSIATEGARPDTIALAQIAVRDGVPKEGGPRLTLNTSVERNGNEVRVEIFDGETRVPATSHFLDRATEYYTRRFRSEPVSLPGNLAFENRLNFQREWFRFSRQGHDAEEAGRLAIQEISFGKHRIARGFTEFDVDYKGAYEWVDLGPPFGKQLVPTGISVDARRPSK